MARIAVTFSDEKDKSTKTVKVPLGTSLLEAAHANDIDLEGDAVQALNAVRTLLEQTHIF